MTTQEIFEVINRLASQLEHFVDHDGLEAPASELHALLDRVELMVIEIRSQLIRERDYGHSETGTQRLNNDLLVRVTGPNFCAGLIVRRDRIVNAAPILARFRGQKFAWFKDFAAGLKWRIEIIQPGIYLSE